MAQFILRYVKSVEEQFFISQSFIFFILENDYRSILIQISDFNTIGNRLLTLQQCWSLDKGILIITSTFIRRHFSHKSTKLFLDYVQWHRSHDKQMGTFSILLTDHFLRKWPVYELTSDYMLTSLNTVHKEPILTLKNNSIW